MDRQEISSLLMLTMMHGVSPRVCRHLLETFGSARAVLEADAAKLSATVRCGAAIAEQRQNRRLRERAEHELAFIDKHGIGLAGVIDSAYPVRLADMADAPVLLYRLGSDVCGSPHVLSVVGTRQATQYGRDMTARIITDLSQAIPNLVVVSGLALGIDVAAHRAALSAGIPTIAVVAHGLDRIYPAVHRQTARQIIDSGGCIVTEYPTDTEPIRTNFLARNRIIAGLSDATLIVESKAHGGALVTASIALSYGREVFAVPGRINDTRSEGCNRLIVQQRALMVTSADDILEALQWKARTPKPQQQEITFPATTELGRRIIEILTEYGKMQADEIASNAEADTAAVFEELLNLEMDQRIHTLAGGWYELN